MDFVTHLSQTSRGHDVEWVIMDHLTKSTNFLVVQMTFTLEEFDRFYIWEIVIEVYRVLQGTRDGLYSWLSIGIAAMFIECSCNIPCLHAWKVHPRSDSCGRLGRSYG